MKKLKSLVTVLCLIVACTRIVSYSPEEAMAAENYTDPSLVEGDGTIYGNSSVLESSSEVMDITLVVENNYIVRIPKDLNVTGFNPTYTVVVEGSLDDDCALKIQPDEYAVFWNENDEEFQAPVTQEKTYWTQADLERTGRSTAEGRFDITGIKSGTWSGSLYFDIELLLVED